MIELDSLLHRLRDGDDSELGELQNQICHQNSVREVAYLVVPRLIEMAEPSPAPRRARLLGLVGTVVASMRVFSRGAAPLREEWRADFESALSRARSLAADTLRDALDPADSFELLAVLAALHGHEKLAIFMGAGPDALSCGACGEELVSERR
jgi:hypothetical protein